MIGKSEYYTDKAVELHQRERSIKAQRGKIYDATGAVLADNVTVCSISVIHNQIEDKEAVISLLTEKPDAEIIKEFETAKEACNE